MNNIKMICLDIDGTLVNSQHKITEKTKEVINIAANQKQISVILVSARLPKGILSLLKELNIVQPIICYSGALILDKNLNLIADKKITLPHVEQIHRFAKELDVHVSLYKDDDWYVEYMDEWAIQEGHITNTVPNIVDFKNLLKSWESENFGPNKIMCMSSPDKIIQLQAKIQASSSAELNVYPSKPTYLEIMPIGASKTSAIEVLCKSLDIDKSDILAIGDNYNDIDMIQFAGLGIAMGNAPEKVKEYADAVTLSNDEDGVAEAIKKYILK